MREFIKHQLNKDERALRQGSDNKGSEGGKNFKDFKKLADNFKSLKNGGFKDLTKNLGKLFGKNFGGLGKAMGPLAKGLGTVAAVVRYCICWI